MEEKYYKTIHNKIFDIANVTYAIIDGASCPELLPVVNKHGFTKHICLYNGDISIKQAESAPYLIRLRPYTDFTKWLITNGWGKHWGIFINSQTDDVDAVAKHFRRFLWVLMPDNEKLYFRYYDPHVLRAFLPNFEQEQIKEFYGKHISCFAVECKIPDVLMHMSIEEDSVDIKQTELTGE